MSHELNKMDRKTLDDAKAMSGSKSLEFGCDWRKNWIKRNPGKNHCDWAAWSGLLGWQLFLVADLAEDLERRIKVLEKQAVDRDNISGNSVTMLRERVRLLEKQARDRNDVVKYFAKENDILKDRVAFHYRYSAIRQ